MKIFLAREFGALNSKPIFDAFEKGVIANGDEIVDRSDLADVVVIWSVLFAGRMAPNRNVWREAKASGKPIVVLEVGNLKRGESWRVGLNGINRTADWGKGDIDQKRFEKFGIELEDWKLLEGGYITLCTQRGDSLQWEGKESVQQWCLNKIEEIRKYSDRAIVIRPHPRGKDQLNDLFKSVQTDKVYFDPPQQTGRDEVNFDHALSYSYCVVNHSAGPGVQAALKGTPVIVSEESLAHDVGINIEDIETPRLIDRTKWLEYLSHTEWFVPEIEEGIPWQRLRKSITSTVG